MPRGAADPTQREQMVKGAAASKAVDAYLRYISTDKPRGRPVDTGLLELKISEEENLAKKVILIAQLREAERIAGAQQNEKVLEDAFVEHVRWFSDKHSITYAVWREMGVGPGVLNRAGVTP